MRPLTFEEREDLCRRADSDLLTFVEKLQWLNRKHRVGHQRLLSLLLHSPKETDLPKARRQVIRNKLAEDGRELTLDEVTGTVEQICCKLRNFLRDSGWTEDKIPDSDIVLMELIHDRTADR